MKKRSLNSLVSRKGFVLFLVLIMIAVISSFLFSIYFLSTRSISRSESFRDYMVAYHAAVSAVKIGLETLKKDNNGYDGEGDDWSNPLVYNYRGIFLSVKISDECGKLNVNKLIVPIYYKMAKRLFKNLELNTDIVAAIKDWIDSDDIVTESGAESYYYEGKGYKPSNKVMKSLYELLYVRGINNSNFKKLSRYLTVYGDGKINVNSAPKELLLSLSEDMDEPAVDSIIENRPIKKLEDLKKLPEFTDELYFSIKPMITNRCDYFKIEVTASYGDSTVNIEAFTDRRNILEWKVVE
ncbi:hypothetical protein Dester_1332 [Desulfurobacterium thermolithotrophum DSM 11699]|uniref:General secretion pathway protein K n=1 Tax=Desulfurobacterium thermolithotrophum (strain DSM 11699 / BSA) TaxID=868864 RepID=F0S1G1_DESTD|nr:type II secretion system minor pseudopilin GspK [Desulfurobacterium thermolithotrophum]ADY73964.1 hypothetical protein Dester_1332 [Desulfurobacterium thermolithotrophum DSM 11699]